MHNYASSRLTSMIRVADAVEQSRQSFGGTNGHVRAEALQFCIVQIRAENAACRFVRRNDQAQPNALEKEAGSHASEIWGGFFAGRRKSIIFPLPLSEL